MGGRTAQRRRRQALACRNASPQGAERWKQQGGNQESKQAPKGQVLHKLQGPIGSCECDHAIQTAAASHHGPQVGTLSRGPYLRQLSTKEEALSLLPNTKPWEARGWGDQAIALNSLSRV